MDAPTVPPPPGWHVFNGQLTPDGTVGGYLARGQEVRGFCDQRDCRRRFWIDFDGLIRRGFAGFPMVELKTLLKCHKPGGCALEVRDDAQGSGLTLTVLARHPQVRVKLRCTDCRWEKVIPPTQVIAHLQAAGTGGGDTLHVALKDKLSKPCSACGKRRWACEVLWPGPDGWKRRTGGRLHADGAVR